MYLFTFSLATVPCIMGATMGNMGNGRNVATSGKEISIMAAMLKIL